MDKLKIYQELEILSSNTNIGMSKSVGLGLKF